MSRYTIAGNAPRYRLRVGVDTVLPIPSLFGHVLDLGWQTDGVVLDEQEETIGDTPEEGLLVWVGGSVPPLWDLETLVSALAPYGQIPLTLQLTLLEELDALAPFPLSALGKHLLAICRQDARARLSLGPEIPEQPFVILTAQGWHLSPWQRVAHAPRQQLAQILFPNQQAPLEVMHAFAQDFSLRMYLHKDALTRALPVSAILASGITLLLYGPICVTQGTGGLTARQLQMVQQELFFVPADLQPQVNALWFRAWASPSRGW